MSNTIYVGRVSYDASEEDIREAFAVRDEEGNITNIAENGIRIIDKTGEDMIRRKFAFVEMKTEEQAQAALSMDGKEILGRPVQVRIAEKRPERTGGFQGNRSGGNFGNRGGGNNFGGGNRGFTPRDGGRRPSTNW